ncbi:MAG TPA: hypothetical protein V6C58_23950, partial [Allocoleopsis sp.]
LRSIDAMTTQRKLLIYVHNARGFNIYVDKIKLEYVLWEIFLNICNMLHHTSKIEVWCLSKKFPVDHSSTHTTERAFVELLIMQQGSINPDVLNNETNDFIWEGNFKELPSSHLKICQKILRSWGCELLFYELENGHFIYQLLLSQV